MRRNLAALTILLTTMTAPVWAQECDDFDPCTSNEMCSAGECTGTPLTGIVCDDGDECTVNDQCNNGSCAGTQAGNGTPCRGGCGACQAGFCVPDQGHNGDPCDDNFACTTNDRCQFGVCFGDFFECPDTDNNACTIDICNPLSGACEHFDQAPCPSCQSCVDQGGGEFDCVATGNGSSCNDLQDCTGDGTCSNGECLTGAPITPGGATPTAIPTLAATPTRTATILSTPTPITPGTTVTPAPSATMPQPTPTSEGTTVTPAPSETVPPPTPTSELPTPTGGPVCVGDCDGSNDVVVDEIITAVNIALGLRSPGDCSAADSNHDLQVTVDEILGAVNNALNGC